MSDIKSLNIVAKSFASPLPQFKKRCFLALFRLKMAFFHIFLSAIIPHCTQFVPKFCTQIFQSNFIIIFFAEKINQKQFRKKKSQLELTNGIFLLRKFIEKV